MDENGYSVDLAAIKADYEASRGAAMKRYNALRPARRWLIQLRNIIRLRLMPKE